MTKSRHWQRRDLNYRKLTLIIYSSLCVNDLQVASNGSSDHWQYYYLYFYWGPHRWCQHVNTNTPICYFILTFGQIYIANPWVSRNQRRTSSSWEFIFYFKEHCLKRTFPNGWQSSFWSVEYGVIGFSYQYNSIIYNNRIYGPRSHLYFLLKFMIRPCHSGFSLSRRRHWSYWS